MARKHKLIELTSVTADHIYLLRCHDTGWKSIPVRVICGEPGWLRGHVKITISMAQHGRYIAGWATVKAVTDDKGYDIPVRRDTSDPEAPWVFATPRASDPSLLTMPVEWADMVQAQLNSRLTELKAEIAAHQKVIDAHNELREKLRVAQH